MFTGDTAEIAIVGIGIGLAILYLTYRFFRHGSEIIQGEFRDKRASAKDTMKQMADIAKQLEGGLV
ncbi:MAG: hypothetical protein QW828_05865 [Candidatus Bathyarchaeia archaeon]